MENVYKRALERERKAKLIAEEFIEKRLRELYIDNINLYNNLNTQAEFQKELLDNLVDALFVVDFEGNILKINKEARRLIGVSKTNSPKNINEFSTLNRNRIYEHFNKYNSKNNKKANEK